MKLKIGIFTILLIFLFAACGQDSLSGENEPLHEISGSFGTSDGTAEAIESEQEHIYIFDDPRTFLPVEGNHVWADYTPFDPLDTPPELLRRAAGYFAEMDALFYEEGGLLWGFFLHVPVMIVDLETRGVIANRPDNQGVLIPMDGAYAGVLPAHIYLPAWGVVHEVILGERWVVFDWAWLHAMQYWEEGRTEMVASAAFRWHQYDMLGERTLSGADHFFDADARISIRMEINSLANALDARDEESRMEHITNALSFRNHRRRNFDGTAYENSAELWDGLQSYMQLILMRGRQELQQIHGFGRSLALVGQGDSLHSQFGRALGVLYALLLDEFGFPWKMDINAESDLGQSLQNFLGITPHYDVSHISAGRHYLMLIEREEREWVENALALMSDFNHRMENHTAIKFFNEDVHGFIGGLTNGGRVPMRISAQSMSDFWVISGDFEWGGYFGTLYVQDDTLFFHNDGFTFISAESIQINGNTVTADTWTLELNDGYGLMAHGDNFRVVSRT